MDIAWIYGEIYRALAASGNLIGSNDLWIAATGLAHQLGVVTNNVKEFRRVPGLVVETF
jgi:tRNA(fMet)-specific endonuclease VapC